MKVDIAKKEYKGEIISSGAAQGTLCFVDFKPYPAANRTNISHADIAKEISRFQDEVNAAIDDLRESINILKKDSLFEEAEIIQTHVFMLEDKEFQKRVREKIEVDKLAAEFALEYVLQEMITVLENSENMLFAERAADLKDIEARLKKRLFKEDSAIFSELLKNAAEPVVVVKELLPSMVLEAKVKGVCAFIVREGTSFSHAAILTKSFGLPVLRIENIYSLGIRNSDKVLINAIHGKMLINPDEEDINSVSLLTRKPYPIEGVIQLPVKLWINVIDPLQIKEEKLKGVEGIGLYRTEFLFMKKKEDFPDENEQFIVYSSLFKKCKGYPVTVRTLDIGGDKTLPYFSLGPQQNPYLGFRAHRIYRFHPEIFITQIRAILRAALDTGNLRILYPMIETVDDLWFVQGLLNEAIQSLENEGIAYRRDFQQGILVEVPSAVWNLRELLHYVNFASLGTNDLFQYFFAVDRNNANIYRVYQPENPVALRMLKNTVNVARELKKSLNICGEIASDINFLPLLVGLGFEHISIDLNTVYAVKKKLLSFSVSECKKLAQRCLAASRIDDVKAALDEFNSSGEKIQHSDLTNDSEFIDPICKMIVHAEGNKLAAARDGRKYYFCCKQCRDKFVRNGG